MATLEENMAFEDRYREMDLMQVIHEMKEIQNEKDALDKELSALNKRYDYIRLNVIPNRFDDLGVTNMSVEGIGRVALTSDIYASIKSDKKHDAYQWLSDTGHGDVIQPSINPSTLKAMIKAIMKNGEEIPEEFFNVTPFTRASITKV